VIEMALEGDRTCLKMCLDRILPTHKAVELKTGSEKGDVIINIGGLNEKVIEAEAKEPLDYEEGVIIEDEKLEETIVNIGSSNE